MRARTPLLAQRLGYVQVPSAGLFHMYLYVCVCAVAAAVAAVGGV